MRSKIVAISLVIVITGWLADRANSQSGDRPQLSVAPVGSSQILDTIIDPTICWPLPIGVQRTPNLEVYYSDQAQIGWGSSRNVPYLPNWSIGGLQSPAGSGLMYMSWCGIWIGGIVGEDTLVSQTDAEFFPPTDVPRDYRGSMTYVSEPADYGLRLTCSDSIREDINYRQDGCREWGPKREHVPMPIVLTLRSYVWRAERTSDIIIWDALVTNVGEEPIREGWFGLWIDPEIYYLGTYGYRDDMVGTLPDLDLVYAIDNDADPHGQFLPSDSCPTRALSVMFLRTSFDKIATNFNWFARYANGFSPRMRGTAEYPFREYWYPSMGEPSIDEDRYYTMRKPEWDYDQVFTSLLSADDPIWRPPDPTVSTDITDGIDISYLLSVGQFDLEPDSSCRVLFATMVPQGVIDRPDLAKILELLPQYYTQVLKLDPIRETAAVADSLTDLLLDPAVPVTGLRLLHNNLDSLVIAWDERVFPGVDEYNIYYTAIPTYHLPHPGTAPPWYRPANPVPHGRASSDCRYVIDSIDNTMFYCIQVAPVVPGGEGMMCDPLIVRPGGRPAAPGVDKEYSFINFGEPPRIAWTQSERTDIDHYNIYRFTVASDTTKAYHSFYDLGFRTDVLEADNRLRVGDSAYYHYSMKPVGQVAGADSEYVGLECDSTVVYAMTSVDITGYESDRSLAVALEFVNETTKDILVLTHSIVMENFVHFDTIQQFYDKVLSGYDYDVYNCYDSFAIINCPDASHDCMDWLDFTRYRLVIVDDGLQDAAISAPWERATSGLAKFMLAGGRVAWFGSLSPFQGFSMSSAPGWSGVADGLPLRFFGYDSLFYVGLGHFMQTETPPFTDTSFAFSMAEGIADSIPSVSFAANRYPFTTDLRTYWPDGSPPTVSVFKPSSSTFTTHVYRSSSPGSSIPEGQTVGLRSPGPSADNFLFGFHLWYMNIAEAKELIDWIFPAIRKVCCADRTGNIDQDTAEQIDIADLTMLIDFIYITHTPIPCPEAANTDGDLDGRVDVGDLTRLIDYLFMSGVALVDCPPL